MNLYFPVLAIALLAFAPGVAIAGAAPWIVEKGAARAAIVTAENPPRMVDLAVRELQAYIHKISGAELPIGTKPDPGYPVTIYVGR
jgi:hypothetical protein